MISPEADFERVASSGLSVGSLCGAVAESPHRGSRGSRSILSRAPPGSLRVALQVAGTILGGGTLVQAMRWSLVLVVVVVMSSACGGTETAATTAAAEDVAPEPPAALASQTGYAFPDAPEIPTGELAPEVAADLDTLFASLQTGFGADLVARIGESGDARVAWLLADILRFFGAGAEQTAAVDAFEALTGADISADPLSARSPWQSVTNHLIAWDVPAPPGYLDWKRIPFEIIEPKWKPFFDDPDAAIDWRVLSWGGVLIDDRVYGDQLPCPRGCIPALDDPGVTGAAEGDWYPDDSIVFGVVVDGEARAYPKNQMEVHEMVNDTLGGRRIAIPYCTLCGSAQAYYTDDVAGRSEPLVMRTSGLLVRSNKVMYELTTFSVFDTFRGNAVSGPLQDQGVVLEQLSVVTSTWGDWKAEHPETTIVARDGGIDRVYPDDPLRGRDDAGPIFPVGDVDARLPAQEPVLGVVAPDGTEVAFPVVAARAAIEDGKQVELAGVVVIADGSGIRAVDSEGNELTGHQAFWFAWSQFQPATLLWTPLN